MYSSECVKEKEKKRRKREKKISKEMGDKST